MLNIHQHLLDKQIKKLKSSKYDIKRNTRWPIIFRGGAKISNNFLQNYALDTLSRASNPVIILWFGTCELTIKTGKYILLSNNLDGKLEEIRQSYVEYKEKILRINSGSKVIYLECPYQSLIMWNFGKGHPTPGIFIHDQKILEDYTTKLNKIIAEINGKQVVPHLAQDFQFSIKKKKRAQKYLKNYSLLYDGVHPGKILSQIWYLRIMRMLSFA